MLAATLVSFVLRGKGLRIFNQQPLLWLFVVPIVVAGVIGSQRVDDIVPFFFENELLHYTEAFGYLRDALLRPLLFVPIALLIGAVVAQAQKPERFLTPVILAVWVMSLSVIGFVLTSEVRLGALASTGARQFLSSVGMHANDLGRLFAVAYGLLLFTWSETKDRALKTVLVATMGALVLALLFTFSRGAFAGFLLINALFLMWKFNARTAALAIFVLVLATVVMPGVVMRRVSMGFDSGDANAVTAGRADEIWTPLMPEVISSPPWGNGLDSIMWSDAAWSGTMLLVGHPHNAYLQVILDMGLIGLGLLLAYYFHVWKGFRALGSNAYLSPTMRGFFQGATAGLLCMLVTGFAGSSLRPAAEFAFLWVAIGMMYGMRARTAQGAPKPAA